MSEKKLTKLIIAPHYDDKDVEKVCNGMDIRGENQAIMSNQRVMAEMLRKLLGLKLDREKIADLCHEQWSGWMEYLFKKSRQTPDGSVVIPKEFVDRWWRQMKTPYEKLSEEEKDSDRKEADKFIALLK